MKICTYKQTKFAFGAYDLPKHPPFPHTQNLWDSIEEKVINDLLHPGMGTVSIRTLFRQRILSVFVYEEVIDQYFKTPTYDQMPANLGLDLEPDVDDADVYEDGVDDERRAHFAFCLSRQRTKLLEACMHIVKDVLEYSPDGNAEPAYLLLMSLIKHVPEYLYRVKGACIDDVKDAFDKAFLPILQQLLTNEDWPVLRKHDEYFRTGFLIAGRLVPYGRCMPRSMHFLRQTIRKRVNMMLVMKVAGERLPQELIDEVYAALLSAKQLCTSDE